jgi:ABC-type uncharacterized transport system permease subunit
MNRRLVLGLGVTFGLLMGLGAVMGWPAWLGNGTAIAVVVVSTVIFARAGGRAFTNGFFTGLLIGVLQCGLVLVLWDQYNANRPQSVERLAQHLYTNVLGVKTYILMFIPLISVIYGLVIGSCSWLLGRLIGLGKNAIAGGSKAN